MQAALTLRVVPHGSAPYQRTLELRKRVLLAPLGVALTEAALRAEAADTHLTAWRDTELVACLILTRVNDCEVRMRQVAVAESEQRRGHGRRLVEEAERMAGEQGFVVMRANARAHVVPFYQRLGYRVVGEPFEEVGIPHQRVEKPL